MHGQIEAAAIGEVVGEVKTGVSAGGKRWHPSIRVGAGEEAQWPRVSAFGDVAASLEGRLAKGSKVYCEGSIRLNNWQSGQGEARSGLSISAKRCASSAPSAASELLRAPQPLRRGRRPRRHLHRQAPASLSMMSCRSDEKAAHR